MKNTRKYWLVSIVSLFAAFLAIIGIGQLLPKDDTLHAQSTLYMEAESTPVSVGEQLAVTIHDERDFSTAVTEDMEDTERTAETSDTLDSCKVWQVIVPEGLNFDEEATAESMAEAGDEEQLPSYDWQEETRTLLIETPQESHELTVLFTTEKSGSFELEIVGGDSTAVLNVEVVEEEGSSLEQLETTVEDLVESHQGDEAASEAPAAASQRAMPLAAGVAVTDWESFVRALADKSVTEISLQNDITLSGTLSNYDSLFSTETVDMTSAENVYFYMSKAGISRDVTINGNGFTFNFGNLAIGMLNATLTGSQQYWTFNFENIDIVSRNYSGPVFHTSHSSSNLATEGLTGTAPRRDTSINFSADTNHTREVANFTGYLAAIMDVKVPYIKLMDDIMTTEGSSATNTNYYQYSPSSNTSQRIMPAFTLSSGDNTNVAFSTAGTARKLVIDGDGHTVDYGSLGARFTTVSTAGGRSWDITMKNMSSYHGNWWGSMLYYGVTGDLKYENYYAVGAQMLESDETNLVFAGDVEMYQVQLYTSKGKDGHTMREWRPYQWNASSMEATLSISNCIVEDNANIHLESLGSMVLRIPNGEFIVGDNVEMSVVKGGTVSAREYGNANLLVTGGGTLEVGEGSTVNMINNHSSYGGIINLSGSGSTIIVKEGGELNVISENYAGTTASGSDYNMIHMAGGEINVNGTMNVYGRNMGASTTHVFYVSSASNFIVGSKGKFHIESDSSSMAQFLLRMTGSSSKFEFTDAERVNLERKTALAGNPTNQQGLIYSAGILNVSVQNVYQWNYGNVDGGVDGDSGHDFAYEPMSKMLLNYSSNAVSTITQAYSMTNETATRFRNNFTTRAQRLLFTRIPDADVAITSIATDNHANNSSTTVTGYATPGAYIRVWDVPKTSAVTAAFDPSTDSVVSPVDDPSTPEEYRNNFTTRADGSGQWSVTVPAGNYFTAESEIHVYAFYNLKEESVTQTVLDKTNPEAEASPQAVWVDETIPTDAADYVKNETDSNPYNEGFTYAFKTDNGGVDPALVDNTTSGTYKVEVIVTDKAGNQIIVESGLQLKFKNDTVTVYFKGPDNTDLYDASNTVIGPVTLTNRPIDTPVNMNNESTVQDVIDEILDTNNYTLETQSWDVTDVEVVVGGTEVTYVFSGLLRFGTVSSTVKFDDSFIMPFDQIITRENNDWEMNVIDTRAAANNKGQWHVTAKLADNFLATDGSGATLTNVLYYVKEDGTAVLIDTANDQRVVGENAGTQANKITWAVNKGLELRVPAQAARNKTYEATVNWTLNNTY